jgi:uncharacterized protein YjiS (DUF1127 family)
MQFLHICPAFLAMVFCRCKTYLLVQKTTARNAGNLAEEGDTMSAIDMNRMGAGTHSTGALARILERLTAWNDVRVTRNSLSRLSDHELNDIGLCRGDIERVARRF